MRPASPRLTLSDTASSAKENEGAEDCHTQLCLVTQHRQCPDDGNLFL